MEDAPGHYQVVATYQNVPKLLEREGSPIHLGTLILEMAGRRPVRMSGSYWTDRNTKGELTLVERRWRLRADFQSAKALFKTRRRHSSRSG